MSYTVKFVSKIDDKPALNALLHQYYSEIETKLAVLDFRTLDIPELLDTTWENIDSYFPPDGRVVLAHDPQGKLVGCGFLRQVRPDAGELKRLFVHPDARGSGLGRELVTLRMQAAADMGWKTLLVDTVKGNTAMLKLYETLGFFSIGRYPESANSVEFEPYCEYLQCDI